MGGLIHGRSEILNPTCSANKQVQDDTNKYRYCVIPDLIRNLIYYTNKAMLKQDTTQFGQSIILETSEELALSDLTELLVEKSLLENGEIAPGSMLEFLPEENKAVSVDLVRQLIRESQYKARSSKRVLILRQADSASIVAQNALLKVLEEPPANTLIILTVRRSSSLLPTIQSRCIQIRNTKYACPEQRLGEILNTNAPYLLPKTYSEAVELSEKYKDRSEALELVQNLILEQHEELKNQPSPMTIFKLRVLQDCQKNLSANVNVRLCLEHCFFSLIRKKPILPTLKR